MEDQKVNISFSNLKEGMVVAKDVEQNGKVVLRKGIILTNQMIDKIQKLYILGEVEVLGDKATRNDKKVYKVIEREFEGISFQMKKTFFNFKADNTKDMNEIRSFAKKIQDELKSDSIMIRSLTNRKDDNYSIYRHSVNVAALSCLIGRWLKFSSRDINLLTYAAIFHDFGKTKISSDIVNKKSKLTWKEANELKDHVKKGYEAIKDIPFLDKSVSYGVLMHHERIDGSGYPLGVTGEKIHPFAKIIAIADVFDVMNSDVYGKKKKHPLEVLQSIKDSSLRELDYNYVNVFLEHMISFYLGEEVLLNTNERCKIIQINQNDISRPLILKDDDFFDLSKIDGIYIDKVIL